MLLMKFMGMSAYMLVAYFLLQDMLSISCMRTVSIDCLLSMQVGSVLYLNINYFYLTLTLPYAYNWIIFY